MKNNQYTVLDYGSTFEFVESELRRQGYEMYFACTYGSKLPEDFNYGKDASGWEMRRLIKAWCKKHNLTRYKIIRNRGYVQDLHGIVYELWLKYTELIDRNKKRTK